MAKMQKLLSFLFRKWHSRIIKSGGLVKSNFLKCSICDLFNCNKDMDFMCGALGSL